MGVLVTVCSGAWAEFETCFDDYVALPNKGKVDVAECVSGMKLGSVIAVLRSFLFKDSLDKTQLSRCDLVDSSLT